MKPSFRHSWTVALNILGVALIVPFWQPLIGRIVMIAAIPKACIPLLRDGAEFLFLALTFVLALLSAFTVRDRDRQQIPWLHRGPSLYWIGVGFMVLYGIAIAATSSFVPETLRFQLHPQP